MSKEKKYTFTTTREIAITKTIVATSETQARYRFKNKVYKDWFHIEKVGELFPDWEIELIYKDGKGV